MPGSLVVPSDSIWHLLERLSVFSSVGDCYPPLSVLALPLCRMLHVPVKFAGSTIPEIAIYSDYHMNDIP